MTAWWCTKCASMFTGPIVRTIDERYPLGRCPNHGPRGRLAPLVSVEAEAIAAADAYVASASGKASRP